MSGDLASGIVRKYGLMASFDAQLRRVQARSLDGRREQLDRLWAELADGRCGSELQAPLHEDFALLKAQAARDCGFGLNHADYLLLREGGLLDERDCADRRLAHWARAEAEAEARTRAGPLESPRFRPGASAQAREPEEELGAREARLLQVQKKLDFLGQACAKPEQQQQQLVQSSSSSEGAGASGPSRLGPVTFGKEAQAAEASKSSPPEPKPRDRLAGEETTAFKSDLLSDRGTPKSYLRVLRRQDCGEPPAPQTACFERKGPGNPRACWFESRQFLLPEQVQEFELEKEPLDAQDGAPAQRLALVEQSLAQGRPSEVPALDSFERLEPRLPKPESGSQADPLAEPADGRPPSAQTLALLFDGLLLSDPSSSVRSGLQVAPLLLEQRLSCTDCPAAQGADSDSDAESIRVQTDRLSLRDSAKEPRSQSSGQSHGLDCLLPTSTERKRGEQGRLQRVPTVPGPAEELQGTSIFPSQSFPAPALQQQLSTIPELQQVSDLSAPSKLELRADRREEPREPAAAQEPHRRESQQQAFGVVRLGALFDSKSEWCFSKSPGPQRCSLASELKAARIHSEANSGLKSHASPARLLVQTPPNAALLQSQELGGPEAALKESLLLTHSQLLLGVEVPCAPGGHLHYSSLPQQKPRPQELPGQHKPAEPEPRKLLVVDCPAPASPALEPASSSRVLVAETAFEARPSQKHAVAGLCPSSESGRTPIRVTPSAIRLAGDSPPCTQPRPKRVLSEFDSTSPPN